MTRIIYTWHVAPEKLERFIETWIRTTNRIHKEVKGAQGSFMLQSDKDTKEIKTIAKWDSLSDWENFWNKSKHYQMESMHKLGERVSVEIFKEIDDFTR